MYNYFLEGNRINRILGASGMRCYIGGVAGGAATGKKTSGTGVKAATVKKTVSAPSKTVSSTVSKGVGGTSFGVPSGVKTSTAPAKTTTPVKTSTISTVSKGVSGLTLGVPTGVKQVVPSVKKTSTAPATPVKTSTAPATPIKTSTAPATPVKKTTAVTPVKKTTVVTPISTPEVIKTPVQRINPTNPTYTLNIEGKTFNYTASQLAAMTPEQKQALKDKTASGKATISYNGKDITSSYGQNLTATVKEEELPIEEVPVEEEQKQEENLDNLLDSTDKTLGQENLIAAEQKQIDASRELYDETRTDTQKNLDDVNARISDTENYIKTVTDPQMQQVIQDRFTNIKNSQAQILDQVKLMDDSKDRIIRLQSNEATEGIARQYMAKGMDESSARAQAQADINKQIMNERQTLLQAQYDTAALTKDVVTWAANAKDLINQAKSANIQYSTELEQNINQLYADAINNKYSVDRQNFANYVGTTTMKAFQDMTDIEKLGFEKMLDINLADKDKRYAVQQLLAQIPADLITARSGAVYDAVHGLNNGTMDLNQAILRVMSGPQGAGGGTGTGTTSTSSTPGVDDLIDSINKATDTSAFSAISSSLAGYSPADQAKIKQAMNNRLVSAPGYASQTGDALTGATTPATTTSTHGTLGSGQSFVQKATNSALSTLPGVAGWIRV